PVRATLARAVIEATDNAFAAPAKQWHVEVPTATAGPIEGDVLPLEAEVHAADGVEKVHGKVHSDGFIEVDADVQRVDVSGFGPYLSTTLEAYGVVIAQGRATTVN